jgi:hypothetical protein
MSERIVLAILERGALTVRPLALYILRSDFES